MTSARHARLLILPLIVFGVIATFCYLGLSHDPRALPSALIDQPAPDFALKPLIAGAPGLSRADIAAAGQPVLVNFFASWCAPCRVEHSVLNNFAKTGTTPLYGIVYKDRPDEARQYLTTLGDPYKAIGTDPDGRTGIDFGLYGVPETYLIDGSGRVRYRYAGPITQEVLDQEILPRLKALKAGG